MVPVAPASRSAMSVIDSSPSNGPWIASAPCSNRWIPGHRRHWAEDGRERRREVAGTADQLVGRVDFLDADGSWASRGLRTSRSCRAIGSCLPAWASDSAVSAGEEHESEKDQSNGPGGHFNLARTWTSELGRGGSWNVTLIVHALVQDANDINAVRSGPIKQDMQAGGILAIALSYFQAFPTKFSSAAWSKCGSPSTMRSGVIEKSTRRSGCCSCKP